MLKLGGIFVLLVFLAASCAAQGALFDGVNDNINFGTDASIDGYATRTYAFWMTWASSAVVDFLLVKSADNTTSRFGVNTTSGNLIQFAYSWTLASPAAWVGTTNVSGGGLFHVVVTYDNGSTTNDPSIYVNGVAESLTENTAPTGLANSDAANSFRAGESDAGGGDFNGSLAWICYDNTIWTAAQINQHYWYGRIGGGGRVVQPPTNNVLNKGSATADGTVTGAVRANVSRGERRHMTTLGVGT